MEKVRLVDLECFISDGNYSSKYPRNDEFVKEGVPFIRCNNFKNNTIIKEDMYYITKEKHSFLLKGHVKEGDILITTRGSLGQVAIVPKEYEDANINAQIVLLRVNKEKVYNRYLMWQLKSQSVQNQIEKNKTGTALQQLPISRLKKIEFFIEEDVKKQLKIADKLDKVQEIIDFRKKQIEELDELIKSKFVEMFDWYNYEEKELAEVSNFIDYRGHTPQVSKNGIIRMINAKSVGKGFFKYVDEYVTEELYIECMHRGYAYPGDVLFVTEGHTFGNTCLIPNDLTKFALGQRVITIQGNKDLNNTYLCYYMQLDEFKSKINMYKTGGTAQGIRSKDLLKITIPIPPIELQNQFAEIVKQVDKQKFMIKKSLKETEELQASFMNKYFN